MEDLLVHELRDLLYAEKQLVKALPKMAAAAHSPRLAEAFKTHREETLGHVQRLEQIFESLELAPRGEKCEAMEGLIAEGAEILEAKGDDQVRDAALIAAAQRVEHYEIAGYGCARTFAAILGKSEAAELLQQTLDEEKATDELLTELAMADLNLQAAE
jgi:ferritin-like metal-binding protein YciE